ncbi:hypothetical protein PgNI_05153 [Pyricularia grisea]|uniref:Uncharacterized protein n=1 Tax=Pyricularia grisea TaxID=148305 RepID=A0A6P8B5M8_PYRGI|nr:hypothetical protein PgNI_05153 [Pyricularia grisea]TLD10646.1 hypothetical protein PgNI_05153 [Pyricularia grisea]
MPNTSEVDGVEPRETRLTIPILSALRKQLESEPLMLCGYSSTATEAQLAESQQTFGTESFCIRITAIKEEGFSRDGLCKVAQLHIWAPVSDR